MRKFQQRQLLELLKTIGDAQAAGLYADAQDGAVYIGEFVESIKGEGTQTVALLEDYCDLLFKASNGEAGDKALRRQLISIENSIKTELRPDRIEVLLLPYQPSMWDSLESIYFAAKDDGRCDAFVVPMPYYELNPDESINYGKMHYDGDKLPKNIPVTDYRNYDISLRRPDIIFTLYPFDDDSSNFSVHPDYYSAKLREHCELLAYVPYFVSDNGDVPDYNGFLPGVIYASRVIAQSEVVRQSYIKHYKSFNEQYRWGGRFGKAEDKFVALGSPKFDKVINSRPEDYALPKRWEELIFKPDGAKKKVVLYNTHMFRWMEGGERYFKKLKHIFSAFKVRSDAVLWWRPHPNTEINFRTKYPAYLDEYLATVAYFKDEGIGIYDDTPDLHRAIAWTDMYYGDQSSLVAMYQAAGKPVVIQDVEETGNNAQLAAMTRFSKDDDGNYWAFDNRKDALVKVDLSGGVAHYAAKGDAMRLYGSKARFRRQPICVGDEIYCFPRSADNILVYNRNSKQAKFVPLDCDYLLSTQSSGFMIEKAIPFQEKIYCFGSQTKAIVVFDTKTHAVRYDVNLFKDAGMIDKSGNKVKSLLIYSKRDENGAVNLLFQGCRHFVRYTLPTQEYEHIRALAAPAGVARAKTEGESLWLITDKGDALIDWNPASGRAARHPLPNNASKAIANTDKIYSGIINCGDYLLLFPLLGDAVVKFDKKSGCFSKCTEFPVPEDNENKIRKYNQTRIGDKVFAYAIFSGTVYALDIPSGEVSPHNFTMSDIDHRRYMADCLRQFAEDENSADFTGIAPEWIVQEALWLFAAEHGYDNVVREKLKGGIADLSANTDGTAGKAIYERMKREIMPE